MYLSLRRSQCVNITVWFIVAAKKGGKKTAAHRLIRQPLEAIEKAKIEE